jgi:hypothetical protein
MNLGSRRLETLSKSVTAIIFMDELVDRVKKQVDAHNSKNCFTIALYTAEV